MLFQFKHSKAVEFACSQHFYRMVNGGETFENLLEFKNTIFAAGRMYT